MAHRSDQKENKMKTIQQHNKPLADAMKAKGFKWKAKDGKAYFVDSNGQYWAHLRCDETAQIVDSGVEYDFDGYTKANAEGNPHIPQIAYKEHVKAMKLKIIGPFVDNSTL